MGKMFGKLWTAARWALRASSPAKTRTSATGLRALNARDLDAQVRDIRANFESLTGGTELRKRIVAHRGLHRLSDDDSVRPVENTRLAYIAAAKTGVGYVEGDAHLTADGEVVLSHDAKISGGQTKAGRDTKPIKEMLWSQLSQVELSDGSYPVLLKTVLQDLADSGTEAKMALEVKTARASEAIATLLIENPRLLARVGFVMSFSFAALELFSKLFRSLNSKAQLPEPKVIWLSCVGSAQARANKLRGVPQLAILDATEGLGLEDFLKQAPEPKLEWENFDYMEESVTDFFRASGRLQRFADVCCGLNIQYNKKLTPERAARMRRELELLFGEGKAFLAMWSEGTVRSDFDRVQNAQKWTQIFDGVNTDFPEEFFTSKEGSD